MTKYLTTFVLVLCVAGPALAATQSRTGHFAVKDAVGNCAVVDTLPSKVSGLRIVGNKAGYASVADAQKPLARAASAKSVEPKADAASQSSF